jgi:hypothetical protein
MTRPPSAAAAGQRHPRYGGEEEREADQHRAPQVAVGGPAADEGAHGHPDPEHGEPGPNGRRLAARQARRETDDPRRGVTTRGDVA